MRTAYEHIYSPIMWCARTVGKLAHSFKFSFLHDVFTFSNDSVTHYRLMARSQFAITSRYVNMWLEYSTFVEVQEFYVSYSKTPRFRNSSVLKGVIMLV